MEGETKYNNIQQRHTTTEAEAISIGSALCERPGSLSGQLFPNVYSIECCD